MQLLGVEGLGKSVHVWPGRSASYEAGESLLYAVEKVVAWFLGLEQLKKLSTSPVTFGIARGLQVAFFVVGGWGVRDAHCSADVGEAELRYVSSFVRLAMDLPTPRAISGGLLGTGSQCRQA